MTTETYTDHQPPVIKQPEEIGNNLFPAFLKLENLRLLIVGGGYVGLEKLHAVLQNSPATRIKIVAITASAEIKSLVEEYPNIELMERAYLSSDVDGADIIIAAVNSSDISKQVWVDAKAKGKLINVADTPDLCDFYLSSIVKKGSLKNCNLHKWQITHHRETPERTDQYHDPRRDGKRTR